MRYHPLDTGDIEFYCNECDDDVVGDVTAGTTWEVESACPGCGTGVVISVGYDDEYERDL